MAALAAMPGVAYAAGQPSGCSGGSPHAGIDGVPTTFTRQGTVLQVGGEVSVVGANACDLTDVTATVKLPDATGNPGPPITLGTLPVVHAGQVITLPTVAYTVNVNTSVTVAPFEFDITATQKLPGGDNPTAGSAQRNLGITHPFVSISVVPTPTSGSAPLSVAYDYQLTNSSDPSAVPANRSAFSAVTLTDDTCFPLTFVSGDNAPIGHLDAGETWIYHCTHSFPVGGTFTDTTSFSGTNVQDQQGTFTATGTSIVTATASDLTLAVAHTGDFTQGDAGRAYTLIATNSGNAPTTGAPITVTDTLPAGLHAVDMSGAGWACTLSTLTCTRSDAVPATTAYPPITLTADVAADATSATNTASVSGGGEVDTTNDTALDPTTIVAKTPLGALPGVTPPPAIITVPPAIKRPVAPKCTLTAVAKQKDLAAKRKLVASVRCDKAVTGKLGATASFTTPATKKAKRRTTKLAFTTTTARVPAGKATGVTLSLASAKLKTLLAALKAKRTVGVALALTATSADGGRAQKTATIKTLSAPLPKAKTPAKKR
jgi:uncharacterized repeat protein (TIGR01451 family)